MRLSRLARTRALLAAVAAGALLSFGCTADFATQSEADVILRITNVVGQPGSPDQEEGLPLFSDVCCAIINDNAQLSFDLISVNRHEDVVVGPFNDVQLERYEVRFQRSDGHNTEGVDVPFSISSGMGGIVPANGSFSTTVVVVRHQAKLEPPLRNLHGVFLSNGTFSFGGAGILTTIAEITVHGRTTSGKAVTARTFLEVVFADFAGEG
jgi:hypothetical protein